MELLNDIFLPIFIAALALMLKPGPHFMAMVTMTADARWKSMAVFWTSATLISTINYFVLLSGLALLPEKSGYIYIFVKSIAAIFFVTMGVADLSKASTVKDEEFKTEVLKEKMTLRSFITQSVTGALTTLSNPFVIIFILVVIPGIIGQTSFTFLEIAAIRSAVVLADIVVLSAFCIPIALARNFVTKKVLKWMKFGSAFAMIGIGLYIFVNMLQQWDLYKAGLL